MEDAAGILQRNALIGLGLYWKIQKYDYSGGANIIYIGRNAERESSDSDVTWAVWKLSYSGDNITSSEGPITGSWTDRADLDWKI